MNLNLTSWTKSSSVKAYPKGQELFKAGDELKSLYAIRSGTIKSYTITEQGDEQITAFHLAGDLVGFDAITGDCHLVSLKLLKHQWFVKSLTRSLTTYQAKCLNFVSKSCV